MFTKEEKELMIEMTVERQMETASLLNRLHTNLNAYDDLSNRLILLISLGDKLKTLPV